jgi:hypothetical protein
MSDDIFRGEDESAGAAHPLLDLAAGLFLLLLGIWFAAMSLALPVPGSVATAPGLLPFLTAASLGAMAILLGLSGFRRLSTARPFDAGRVFSALESQRRSVLIVTIIVYIAALDSLSFETYANIAGTSVPLGSFEPITVVALTAMLRFFWTNRLTHCVLVAVFWTLSISLAFRGLFNIPMPG